MIETGLIAARFVHYVALALLFGTYAYWSFAYADERLRRRFRLLAILSSLLALFGSVLVLAATVAGLGGSYASLFDQELWSAVIAETDFGKIWSVRLVLSVLVVAFAIGWREQGGSRGRWVGVTIAGALVATVGWTGHAAIEEGTAGQLHRWADVLHLLAAMAWVGALIPLLWLLAARSAGPEAVRRLTQFHSVGLVAVLTLLMTGLVNSYFLVGAPAALLTTTYGQLLMIKLALFAAMVALAAANRLSHAPALARNVSSGTDAVASIARLRHAIWGELALGVLVLAIVSVLGAIAPAVSP